MQPGHLVRYRALGAVVLGLGGALVLLASRSPEPGAAATLAETCKQFYDNGKAPFPWNEGRAIETGGVHLKLYRHKKPGALQPENGEIVGGVKNLDDTRPSSTFQWLEAGESGCIWFKKRDANTPDMAEFLDLQGGKHALNYALYCHHGMAGNITRKPQWVTLPESMDCETFKISVGVYAVTIPIPIGQPFALQAFQKQLSDRLVQVGMPAGQAEKVVMQITESYGPWYPCDPDGCCRAGEV